VPSGRNLRHELRQMTYAARVHRADRMIPPSAQHTMAERIGATVSEVAASHSVYVSQPEAVATFIAQAAVGPADR
jgi:hypothetical protein